VPLVLELSERVAERMSHHVSFDVTDGAKRITSDVMGQLLYGEDLGGTRWEPSQYLDLFNPVLKAQAAMVRADAGGGQAVCHTSVSVTAAAAGRLLPQQHSVRCASGAAPLPSPDTIH
jgi:hypothetical protein